MKKRILHILIALDQLAYVLLTLGKGYPDMTISAATYIGHRDGKKYATVLMYFIDFLFLPIEKDHCLNSFISEVERNHLPKSFR